MAVKLNRHDLEFILDQIRIAEAHVGGTPLDQLIVQPHLPYGLRTVDGSYNNLIPGRELWGASDQVMPRFLDPSWRQETDNESVDINGGALDGVVDNNDYGVHGGPSATNGYHTGNVVDSDPRIITNLISDQTLNNPAAIAAALIHSGHTGSLRADIAAVQTAYATYLASSEITAYKPVATQYHNAKAAAIEAQQNLIAAEATGDQAAIDVAAAALATAQAELVTAQENLDSEQVGVDAAKARDLEPVLNAYGIEIEGNSLVLPNVAPDEGLSAPFNGWMTFFGQFFDHGLDLIHKGDNGTIFVPLAADDPLRTHGPDGIADSGDEVPASQSFMVLTRLKPSDGPGADGVMGTADDTTGEAVNKTTPFVDQNQTYTSHPSHQVFLREYAMVDGKPMATGRLLDGENGGLPTWADVKQQATEKLGITMSDIDVLGVPLLLTDPYGEFIRGEHGFPQVVINIGPDLIPNTADDVTESASPGNPIVLSNLNEGLGPVRTSHQFLDDIAHAAAPVFDPSTPSSLAPDPDTDTDDFGNPLPFNDRGQNLQYDDELLNRHFITGDGRGNENIGLTAVHHVFHSEHNRQVAAQQLEILKTGDLAFINEWLAVDLTQADLDLFPTADLDLMDHANTLSWDGERIFQAARFATEMQYQHLVFEEFGRKVQPNIDLFIFNTITDVNPAIFAEFAHTVYRFGHSMLTDHLKLLPLDVDGNPVGPDGTLLTDTNGDGFIDAKDDWGVDVGLIEAFLNPILYDQDGGITAEQAAGAIVRGLTYVHGNAIDEFVVEALRNNLLGLPLDLAAINIARGRDAGVPSLNEARAQLYAASNSTWLKPYESWADFGANLKTPASIINFLAAYGTHDSIAGKVDNGSGVLRDRTLQEKRDAAMALVFEDAGSPTDRLDFLNGTGAWAALETGLNLIDLWIGGLAEKIMPFGGMLGSTFNAVFELQLENLQEGDRFYYLSRAQGLNLLNELEDNAFSKLIMANTDLARAGADGIKGTDDDEITHHIGVDSFAKYDGVLEVDEAAQIAADASFVGDDEFLEAIRAKVQRDDPTTQDPDANYLRFTGGEHMVMGGTSEADTIIGGAGDDGIWGGDGDDRIEGGHGVDLVVGGAGDDIITDTGDTADFLKGSSGDDVIANSNGLDVLMGGDGKDVFLVGVDATEVFGGEGDDFMLGGLDHDFLLGNEGDDWMEGGDGFDVLNGDNSELFFNSTILGHDVLFAGENENDFDAESGDDIMVQGESVMRNEGMFGFDWAIYKGSAVAADADMRIPFFTTVADDILRDRFDQTEAISGWAHNDIIRGDDRGSNEEIEVELQLDENHYLSQAGADRIDGLRDLLRLDEYVPQAGDSPDLEKVLAWTGGNLLIGGDGNDLFEGRGGDDFIHGDAWLNVRIRIVGDGEDNTPENELATVDTLKHVFTQAEADMLGLPEGSAGKSLTELLLSREIKPNQMHIVREIKYDENPTNDTDTAIFAGNKDWYEITQLEGDMVRVTRREDENIEPGFHEGTDILVGIERILFADGLTTLRETGNYDPTGRLTISGLPAKEGEELTVDASAIGDMNNPDGAVASGAITFRWQIERNDGTGDYMDIPGTSGSTFTPDDEHVGLRIRVLGIYTDAGGVNEVVSSHPTDPVLNVNDDPVGDILISDMSPTEGQELTATAAFNDPDGITDAFEEFLLTYQWQYFDPEVGEDGEWVNVPAEQGGNARSFTPGSDQVGKTLRMVIDYTDDGGRQETVISAVTQVVGNYIEDADGAVSTIEGGDADGGTTVGDDWVDGGEGANAISGGEGNDVLNGGGSGDMLNGDAGDDTLNGGAGDDTVIGGTGDDTIVYGTEDGADSIDGGGDDDTLLIVQSSNDVVDDTVTVTSVGGIITGVNETTSLTSIENFEVNMAGGSDTLVYDTSDDVTVNLLTGAATGFSFTRGLENATGGSGNDTLQGNSLDNVLDGRGGNDALNGGFGDDTLNGGEGNDDLRGEEGNDVLEGGGGDDRIEGGLGIDTASYANAASSVSVTLSDFVTSEGPQPSFEEQDTGGAGLDRLIGIENLTGSAHDDDLTGDDGDNVIDGGAGADVMAGGLGDDTYVIDDVSGNPANRDRVIEADGGGNDTVQGDVRIDLSASALQGQEIENIVLTGSANRTAIGNDLDNRLTGNAGNNQLQGGTGTDTVVLASAIAGIGFATRANGDIRVQEAGGGNDWLRDIERAEIDGLSYTIVAGTGDANTVDGDTDSGLVNDLVLGFGGNDTLNGNTGDDILVGGGGNDDMVGGQGNDTFVVQQNGDTVNGGAGIDTIISSISVNLHPTLDDQVVNGSVENATLTGSADLDIRGNGRANVLTGNAGANDIFGANGDDTLIGMGGNDTLRGGNGEDMLAGGDGDDTLNGQAGDDIAVFDGPAGNYQFVFDENGLASVIDIVGDGGTDTLVDIERVRFGAGPDLVIASAGAGIPAGPAIVYGTDGNDTITGSTGDDVIVGGAGDDTLNGHDVGDGDDDTVELQADDDTFIWRPDDGSDTINGGGEGVDGDLFQIIGEPGAETYRIYTYDEAVARIGFAGSDESEIVVTRQVEGELETVIAELTEIEEIVINGGGVGASGEFGGDTVEMYGSFDVTTSLRPDTITVLGSSGDDTVNISSLLSDHRIVFKGAGGNDTIIGTLRPQDVIMLANGKTIDDYTPVEHGDGSTTITSDDHTITFWSEGGPPKFESQEPDGEDDDEETPDTVGEQPGGSDDHDHEDDEDDDVGDNEDDDDAEDDDDDGDDGVPPLAAGPVTGTAGDDVLLGTSASDLILGMAGTDYLIAGAGADVIRAGEGDDLIDAGAERDIVFAGEGDDDLFGGADADVLYGESGEDWLSGDAGDDLLDGGTENDTVFGGDGDDMFIGRRDDGDDDYDGGSGIDTLDLGSLNEDVAVDLGTGIGGRGSVTGTQSGTDALYGIENVTTGSGNDTITASNAVNMIDGGDGNDVFVFTSAADADGDTIVGFETGDKIDLSGIDADTGTAGVQSFALVAGQANAPGQIAISHESREDGEFTVVSGNTSGGDEPDFRIEIAGNHTLDTSDFNL